MLNKEEEQQLTNEFLNYYRSSGRTTPRVGVAHRVRKLLSYLKERGLALQAVGYKEALAYQLYLTEQPAAKGKGYSSGSIANYIKKAIVFFEFLKVKGLVVTNPFLDLERVKVKKSLPKNLLKEQEMAKFLAELAQFDKQQADVKSLISHYRAHLLAELMYASGIRIGELARVKEAEIDFSRGVIEVACGKGGKRRLALVGEYALSLLKIYLEELRPLIIRREYHNGQLLFGATGPRLLAATNPIFKAVARKLALPPLTCHSFRHALGTHLLRAGCDIRYIQAILGHRDIQSTEVYTKVDKEDLKAVIDKYHPRQPRGRQE